MRDLIVDTATQVFTDYGEPLSLNVDDTGARQRELWNVLVDTGLTRAWLSEVNGGGGLDLDDGLEILRVAGRFAVNVPLAETLMAGWYLQAAGMEIPEGTMTVCELGPDSCSDDVPFAGAVDRIVTLAPTDEGYRVSLFDSTSLRLEASPATNGSTLAGDPSHRVCVGDAPRVAQSDISTRGPADGLLGLGALCRVMYTAGALESLLDLCVTYAEERVAFERPIGKFQAVQHNLARLAGEVSAANAAASSAAFSVANPASDEEIRFIEIAAAKVRSGEAAYEGGMIAHQAHGAIGYTQEHVLHRFTHRLWSWREQYGDESYWAGRLGKHFCGLGADGLWPKLTSI
jgi:acyl-CoA dehydrogenase